MGWGAGGAVGGGFEVRGEAGSHPVGDDKASLAFILKQDSK